MFDNPFVRPTTEYKRDINILHHYVEDGAAMLQIETGMPYDVCVEFVKRKAKESMKDPDVLFIERQENGDRKKAKQPLSKFLSHAVRNNNLIAPTFTIYLPPEKKKSLLVDYIDYNVAARGVAKKAMFNARMAKDKPLETIKGIEQTGKKLANNAISGAHLAAGTPLYNKTAHSTLTSNCRVTAGYGNANNEKFLSGNRHYWSPDIVRNNIVSIVRNTDYKELEVVMAQYGIRPPTADETMACIEFSARLYWSTQHEFTDIRRLVNKLNDLERAAFVYTGDLYHLMVCNPELVRTFLSRLSAHNPVPHENPKFVLDNAMEDHVHLAAQICPQQMKGKRMIDVKGTEAEGIVAATVQNIEDTITFYGRMIKCLWVTDNMPASVAHFPDSIRRSALTGDTDSTIFTVQDWVVWMGGKIGFADTDNAVAATMIFLAAQTITHVLAKMSANFGIETKRLHQIAMKNEFKFDVFIPTQVAKHYYALIGCQEGNLYADYKKEIKGVHLKTSKIAKIAMAEATKMMEYIMMEVIEKQELSADFILRWIARTENAVRDSIAKGGYEYFRIGQIKPPEGYKSEDPEKTPYSQYLMWEEVFKPKYGECPKPPYMCVKVSTDINTKTDLKQWLASMEDRELAGRMEAYCARTGKTNFTTFQLPEQCVQTTGIPVEILDRIGVRKIILDSTRTMYLVAETCGFYFLDKKLTKLVSDFYGENPDIE